MPTFLKIILSLISWGVFLYVLFFIEYPESLTQASPFQLLAFFTPLYFAISFSLYLIIKNLAVCLVISLGIILLLILKALDSLNFVSGGLAILSVFLLVSYFNPSTRLRLRGMNSLSSDSRSSARSGLRNLTSEGNIPKLAKWRRRHKSSRT